MSRQDTPPLHLPLLEEGVLRASQVPYESRSRDQQLRLELFGGFRLMRDGLDEVAVAPALQRLIALLVIGNSRARTHVSGTLWPDVSDEQASRSLRTAIWRIQRILPGLLYTTGTTLALSSAVSVDVTELRVNAERLLTRREEIWAMAFPNSIMWAELLPGWYEDWVLVERERLRQLRLHALEEMAAQMLARREYAAAMNAALAAVHAEPLRESAHRVVARIHLAEGNRAEALRGYQIYERLLRAELEITPSEEFVALVTPAPAGRLTGTAALADGSVNRSDGASPQPDEQCVCSDGVLDENPDMQDVIRSKLGLP